MQLKSHERRTYIFLLILTIFTMVVFQLWRTLFNNFAVEIIHLDSDSVGLIQSVREIPGFLSFLAIYIILFIREKWLALLSALLLSMGVMVTGFFPTEVGLLLTTFVMSIGFHYYETMNQSLSMQYFSVKNFASATANLRRYGALAAIITGIAITLLTEILTFKDLYFAFGIFSVMGILFALRFLPEEDKVPTQGKKLIFKKKYLIYYSLVFLNGARRQIFTVFALFLLVKRHEYSAATVSILFVVNNLVNFLIYPKIAEIINKRGERATLRIEYIFLILIFISYAAIDHPWAALSLYVLDNFFFMFSIATRSYFQKIADTEDIAPTAGVAFTINHIAAVLIPYIGGLLWLIDWRIPFLFASFLALISLFLTRFVITDR